MPSSFYVQKKRKGWKMKKGKKEAKLKNILKILPKKRKSRCGVEF